jgi:Ca2+/Na+ antiporter
MKLDRKEVGWHFFVILLFITISVIYFSPVAFEGKVLHQKDTQRVQGLSKELVDFNTPDNKEIIAWQGNMFSGMPSYHTRIIGSPANKLSFIGKVLSFLDYHCIRMVFIGLICFYILMYVIGARRWIAVAGAIAFAFASYNIIIIGIGHINKAYVIAYMPLTLAGMCLLFKKHYLWGAVLFTLGVAMSIYENHLQITYYLVLLSLILYICYIFHSLKAKKIREAVISSTIMLGCVILAVSPNTAKLYTNWEMGQNSTRGTTELTKTNTEGKKSSSGLDKDYAFQWSYQKRELLTLLIPNAFGGKTIGNLGPDSELYQKMNANNLEVGKEVQSFTYWGDKSTSGPVYFGALVCFLFVFGMFVIRSPYKWWLFGGALFLTFLALGKYMEWFNNIMFHYLPLYNKFRTVEMALVIPGLVFPMIAIWGLKDLFAGDVDRERFKRGMIGALSITGGLCLIVWLIPNLLLDFSSEIDAHRQLPDWYIQALKVDRASLASADAFRSLVFILLGAGLLFLFWRSKDKKKMGTVLAVGMTVLILADLWTVDKRFLDKDDFI